MIISEEKLGNALVFLAESDDKYAHLKAEMMRAEILVERSKARCFLLADGNVEERKCTAKTSGDVIQAEDTYIGYVKEFEGLRAKRQRAELVVDVFRTLEASRRKA